MFRRKKKDEQTEQPASPEVSPETTSPQTADAELPSVAPEPQSTGSVDHPVASAESVQLGEEVETASATPVKRARGHRVQKVGIVFSDKMQKTVVVRVDRLVRHTKYRRYVRKTTKFKAHDEMGSSVGDRVRIVETRPLSAQKRWRVIEILQKAAK